MDFNNWDSKWRDIIAGIENKVAAERLRPYDALAWERLAPRQRQLIALERRAEAKALGIEIQQIINALIDEVKKTPIQSRWQMIAGIFAIGSAKEERRTNARQFMERAKYYRQKLEELDSQTLKFMIGNKTEAVKAWMAAEFIQTGSAPLTENVNEYDEYLLSPEWRQKAETAKRRAEYRCQACTGAFSPTQLEVTPKVGIPPSKATPEDILALCLDCRQVATAVFSK